MITMGRKKLWVFLLLFCLVLGIVFCLIEKEESVQNIVGASWVVGESTELTRLGVGVGKSSGIDFDSLYPWSEMKPDFKDEQTVVRIPKFYYKRTYDGVKHEFWIADKPTAGFKVHPAFIRDGEVKDYIYVGANKFGTSQTIDACRSTAQGYGAGWGLIDIQTWSAIQMLWLVEYADTDSQKFSYNYRGIISDNYRGINGLWTNLGQWIDGFEARDRRVYIVGQDTGFTLPEDSGWIGNWHCSDTYDWLFLPSAEGGSKNTYIPDYIWKGNGTRVACAGFDSHHSAADGLFFWTVCYSSDFASSDVGARALHIP